MMFIEAQRTDFICSGFKVSWFGPHSRVHASNASTIDLDSCGTGHFTARIAAAAGFSGRLRCIARDAALKRPLLPVSSLLCNPVSFDRAYPTSALVIESAR
jgi:hypothetical protein